jgi:hypothetical protein
MSEKITVTIAKGGKVTLKTEGFTGSACQQATAELERRLGKTINDQPTEEMYAQTNIQDIA